MIAETLLEQETITAEEIESLCKTGKLPAKEATPEETPAEPEAEEPKPEAPSQESGEENK